MKRLIKKIPLRVTADFKEYIEIFSNGDIEIAIYERIQNPECLFI